MKRIVQRFVVIVGVSGGLITAAATGANALIAANHCEPVARDHRLAEVSDGNRDSQT